MKKRLKSVVNERAVAPQSQPNQQIYWPFAAPQQPNVAVVMPNSANYNVNGVGSIIGLPQYQSVDEYGRIYNQPLFYGAQPCSAPVPVARPASMVQTVPITMPIQVADLDSLSQR